MIRRMVGAWRKESRFSSQRRDEARSILGKTLKRLKPDILQAAMNTLFPQAMKDG